MPIGPADVKGAHLLWRERSARRYYDDETNPHCGERSIADGPFNLSAQTGHGKDDDDGTVFSVRVKGAYSKPDTQIEIDVEVMFKVAEDDEVDRDFVVRHALPYVFGYVRGAFTDACRSVGLRGLMLPMVNLEEIVVDK